MWQTTCLLLLIPLVFGASENDMNIPLIVTKDIINDFVFEGKVMTVVYTIYNFHQSRSVKEVQLFDSYADNDFTLLHGNPIVQWPLIPASSNVSHSVILIPHKIGSYNFTSATVMYKTSDDLPSTLLYSSAPGQVMIYRVKEYNKRYASHAIEWIGFALIVTPCLLIPYLLWYSSASKYQ